MGQTSDAVVQVERALLRSVLLANALWPQTSALSADDFCLDSHRKIFRQMAMMFEDQTAVDLPTLAAGLGDQLENCGGPDYVAALLDHALPENFASYERSVRKFALERRAELLTTTIASTMALQSPNLTEVRAQAQQLVDVLSVKDLLGER